MKTVRALLPQKRALAHFILGQLQIMGATMGLAFVRFTGLSVWTIATVSLTGCLTVLSLILKKRIHEHQRTESLAREKS